MDETDSSDETTGRSLAGAAEPPLSNEVISRLTGLDLILSADGNEEDVAFLLVETVARWPGVSRATLAESDNADAPEEWLAVQAGERRSAWDGYLTGQTSTVLPGLVWAGPLRNSEEKVLHVLAWLEPEESSANQLWLEYARRLAEWKIGGCRMRNQVRALEQANLQWQMATAMTTTLRIFTHEAINALKSIECWVEMSRTEPGSLARLSAEVARLRQVLMDATEMTNTARLKRRLCVFQDELRRALDALRLLRGEVLDGCTLQIVGLESGQMLRVYLDGRSLAVMVNNIVTNSREQYASHGRKGPIRLTLVQETRHEIPYVGFEVLDYGPGVADECRTKVFQPGWTTKPEGHGLGLTVVQSLVQANDGLVELESAVGAFTKVKVLFAVVSA